MLTTIAPTTWTCDVYNGDPATERAIDAKQGAFREVDNFRQASEACGYTTEMYAR